MTKEQLEVEKEAAKWFYPGLVLEVEHLEEACREKDERAVAIGKAHLLRIAELEATVVRQSQSIAEMQPLLGKQKDEIERLTLELAEAKNSQSLAWAQEIQHRNLAEHWQAENAKLREALISQTTNLTKNSGFYGS